MLSDTATTVASIAALVAVQWTGIVAIDPLVALVVAANLLWAGARSCGARSRGCSTRRTSALLERIAKVLESARRPEWCDIHQLRCRTVGRRKHIDLHLVVPRYFAMDEAHRVGDALEAALGRVLEGEGDFVVHLDPCRPMHCSGCAMADCPVRVARR